MKDLMGIVKGRRSIRRYQEKEVPDELLQQVLESIQWSPSWANTQCWEVIISRDPDVKARLKEALNNTNPSKKAMDQAPIILTLCAKLKSSGYYQEKVTTKFGDWFMFDIGLATQSLCLAAHDLGLGTVIVGLFDHDKVKTTLGLSEGYEVVVLIPLGYPAKDSPAPRRREISDFCHYDAF